MDTQFAVIQPPAHLRLTQARRLGGWLCFGALLLLAALLGQPTPAHAQSTIITVDADAPGPVYDGLSWATAFTTVQDALDLANANGGMNYEVWVAEGAYYPDEGAGRSDNSRTESFTLTNDNVQLYGGFAATETLRSQRDWVAHPTILSGDIDQNDTNTDGDSIAETWNDIQGSNAYHVLYLDGVTDPSITTATVIDGFIITAGSADGSDGGGLYCAGSGAGNACSPTLTNVTFSGNQAVGGGEYGRGGGMFNNGQEGASSPVLNNVILSGNRASSGDFGGGGMCNWGKAGVSNPMLTNVVFRNNTATHGGAMLNNAYSANNTPPTPPHGQSSPVILNATFSNNSATGDGGAILSIWVDRVVLTNTILWGNTAARGSQIFVWASPVYALVQTMDHSLSQGGDSGIYLNAVIADPNPFSTGAGNIDVDPLFAAAPAGDLRLQACSPAIDGGDDASVTVATDLDGNSRIRGFAVDMGAYESPLLPCLHAAKQVTPTTNVSYGSVVTYTLVLSNTGNLTDTATLTDALPAQVEFGGWVEHPGASEAGNVITWTGALTPSTALTFTFTVTHTHAGVNGVVTNTAFFSGALQAGSASAAFAQSRRVYVDTDAPGPVHDGLSWTTAYTTIQDALDLANANAGTNYEIWVAEGAYYPDEGGSHVNNSPSEYFTLRYDNVRMYGGFGGNGVDETERTQRNWDAHPTTLSGDIDQDGALTNNAWHVLYLDGVTNEAITAATVIDGFTVTGGNAVGSAPDNKGGGIYCAGSGSGHACSPTLANVTFHSNAAAAHGGGIYNSGESGGASSPSLTNVTFSGNTAKYGGGMGNGGSTGASSPTLINVLFSGNLATEYGGAISNDGISGVNSPTLTNVTFSGNRAGISGGALYNNGNSGRSTPLMVNCILWGNAPEQIFDNNALPAVSYSIVQGGYAGAGNLTLDPHFVAPIAAGSAPTTTGNYRLQLASPAIDAGSNLSVTTAIDLDGNPRIVNGVVDMGAYEVPPAPLLRLAKQVATTPQIVNQGVVTYTLLLRNAGSLTETAGLLTDTLPANVTFGAWVENAHDAAVNDATLTWSGVISPGAVLTFTFTATAATNSGATITNTAFFSGSFQAGSAAAVFDLATLRYVDLDAPGPDHDGLSWTTAYTNVQDALGLAAANPNHLYEFWVAEGVYYPDEGQGRINDSRTMSFTLANDNVRLYGGFGGHAIGETLRTQRDWLAHPTLLSGDSDQDGTSAGNAYHVLYLDGVTNGDITAATVLDGFTVTGGNADGSGLHASGGGLYCAGSGSGHACSPTLASLTFRNNAAAAYSGGMYNNGNYGGASSPTLTNVTFSGNTGAFGGGMYNNGENGGASSPTLTNVIFSGNAARLGGGMASSGSHGGNSSPRLTNVTFSGNAAADMGGGMFNEGANGGVTSPTLFNVTFGGNSSADGGGMASNAYYGTSYPVLVNCIVWGNAAPQIQNSNSAATAVSYSIVEGGYGGTGNLALDPHFVAPIAAGSVPTTTGDYRLQAGSPAIDVGSNPNVTVATDLDGNPRIVNGVVDMGAYEAHPVLSLGKQVMPANVPYQGVVTYTLRLSNTGVLTDIVLLTDALPSQVDFGGWIENPGAVQAGNVLTWTGELAPSAVLSFTFTATHTHNAGVPITNTAFFSGAVQAGSAAADFTTQCKATITVQNSADSGAGSLRQAIADLCPGSVIDFAPGLNGATILLDSQLAINKSLTITGSVPITVSGGGSVRIFSVSADAHATLAGLTLYNGYSDNGGAIYNAGALTVTHSVVYSSSAPNGGGMSNDGGVLRVVDSVVYSSSAPSGGNGGAIFQRSGVLIVESSTLTGNAASYGGAIIQLSGVLVVESSTLAGNASSFGGAIYIVDGAATMTDSTFSGNIAISHGGGIYHGSGVLTVAGSTFSNNQSDVYGGGIASRGTFTVTNSTFAANRAGYGGGIASMDSYSLGGVINSTFAGNRAAYSGADLYNGGTLHLANSVLANAAAGANCVLVTSYGGGVITTNLNNLVEDGTCSAGGVNFRTGDPLLGVLGDYGGKTQTFPLLLDSPAIDAGDNATCAAAPVNGVDQRGVTRPQGAVCDIGAFEAPPTPSLRLSKQVTPTTPIAYHGVVTYTLLLSNTGNLTDTVILTDALPAQVDFGGWLANPGATVTNDAIAWTGEVAPSAVLTFTFTATHTHGVGAAITNTAFFSGAVQAGSAAANFTALCRAAITVQNSADSGAGSLRQAIADLCPGGVIDFAPGINGATLPLGGELVIDKHLTITGSVPITLSGDGSVRIFSVNAGVQATLAGLTLYNGYAADNGGAIDNSGALTVTHSRVLGGTAANGGGIHNAGVLVVQASTLSGNTATDPIGGGGALSNTGVLTLTDSHLSGNAGEFGAGMVSLDGVGLVQRSTFTNNLANTAGAGIYNSAGALIVEQCTFAGNATGSDAGTYGGALVTDSGALLVNRTTFANNRAFNGGGVYLMGTGAVAIHNSTLSGNTATNSGGGLYNENGLAVVLLNNTVTGNGAANSGGVQNYGTLSLTNTVIANSTTGGDCRNGDPTNGFNLGTVTANAHNLFASTAITDTCGIANGAGGSLTGVDPLLGALADHSGGVHTHALLPGSPAIDAGDAATCAAAPVAGVDQRKVTRPQGAACDIGAFESRGFTITSNGGADQHAAIGAAFAQPLTLTVASAYTEPVMGGRVVFTAPVSGASLSPVVVTATVDAAGGVSAPVTANQTVGSYTVRGAAHGVTSSAVYTLTNDPGPTTTALASAPNPSAFGQSVTFTATVTANPPSAGLLSGVVTFTTTSGELGASTLSDGVATVTTSSLVAGSHVVTATYGGDGSFAGSLMSTLHVVARSAVVVDFTPAPNPATYGQAVGVAVTVTVLHILPTTDPSVQRPLGPGGVVTLYDGVDAVTTDVVVNGVAAAAWPLPATGAHMLTVVYSGDDRHAPGASAAGALLVVQAATTSTLTAPPAATIYGAPATFTVTVQSTLLQAAGAAPPTPAKPTGQVQLQAGADVLGVGVLVDGVAVIDVGLLAGGVHTLTAAYAGDANYLASSAAAIQHTVLPAPAQANLVAAPNPAAIHSPVTFTATVQAASFTPDGLAVQMGMAPPTGQVTFQAGATLLGSGALANGMATVATDALAFGDHVITAHYAGDANYQAAVSAALTQTITAPTPLARNDAAGVLESEAVTITVLANDINPAGGALTIIAVSQPRHGAASINPDNATVQYTAGAGGVDSFTYTLQDANGQQSTATVAVVVTVLTETDVPPQVAALDPALPHTIPFTSTQATVKVDVPAGIYTGVLAPAQLFFLSYTPIVTPTAHTLTPPGTLSFGNFQFELTAFIDDVPQPGFRFAQPITLTIRYDPALLNTLLPETLALTFWDGTGWSTDGIVILSHDLATGTLTVTLAHLSEFAFFAAAVPTALEPAPEPGALPTQLYLPAVMHAAVDGAAQAGNPP